MRAGAIVLGSLAFASALACSGRGRERVVLGTAQLPAFGLVFIADAKGYFAEQGLDVEQRTFTSGRDALAALAAGEVDAATAFDTAVAYAASAHASLRVLTTLHVARRGTCVVARADRIRSRDGLQGRRIGVPPNTHAEFFLHVVLAYAGLPDAAVETVDVAPEAALDALASGRVDAVAIWPPLVERARGLLGPAGIVEIGVPVYTEISAMVTRDDVLAARPGAQLKLLRALAAAERLVRDRPDEAFAALRSRLPGVPEADLREAWGRIQPGLGITNELAGLLEREADWLRTRGRLSGPTLDVGTTLAAGPLAEVDIEAVTYVSPAGIPPAR